MRQNRLPKKTDSDPLRKRMEANVRAYNSPLKNEAGRMTTQELLACCHPSDREDFIKEMEGKR
ncbi:MAG: hypothetical protein A2Y71_10210 [Bacteroidetes bacterium RBG_13_42_15]|nr:MAG: hypothetical protein A2Y71_10210 [Bacteroidetes bacterium RBG_13_42_15]